MSKKYGIGAGEMLNDEIMRVSDMVEKPEPKDAPSDFAIIGRYILTPDIFDILKDVKPGKNGEIQITDAFYQLRFLYSGGDRNQRSQCLQHKYSHFSYHLKPPVSLRESYWFLYVMLIMIKL